MSCSCWLAPAASLMAVGSAAGQALLITPSSLPIGTVGQPYSVTFTAIGGDPPYGNWAVIGGDSLPAGLNLDATTGVLSGTPTSFADNAIAVSVRDSAGNFGEAVFKISIAFPVTIIGTQLRPDGVGGNAISAFATDDAYLILDVSGYFAIVPQAKLS